MARQSHPNTVRASNWHIVKEQIKYIDLLIEVCDARAYKTSRHPKVNEIFGNKPILLVLNKADLADKKVLSDIIRQADQIPAQKAIALSLKTGGNKKKVFDLIAQLTAEKRKSLIKKGIHTKTIRCCVIGMPNVGKSSLINWLSGRKRVRVADRPGVTRGPQWIKLQAELELLDTPGVLPRENMDKKTKDILSMLNLATASADEKEDLAYRALEFMKKHYLNNTLPYFKVQTENEISFEKLAEKRNFIGQGGKYDLVRAANTFLMDLREGKIAGICLDRIE